MSRPLESVAIEYRITFASPFHAGSGLPRGLLDRAVRRDHEGLLFVPGSTLKGTLRDRCEQMARLFGLTARPPQDTDRAEWEGPDVLSRVFGSRLYEGTLAFDDARMTEAHRLSFEAVRGGFLPSQTFERTQVSLSRLTGAAKQGLLFSSEFGVPGLSFEGMISGHLDDVPVDNEDSRCSYALVLLIAGLLSLDRLGGGRSAGAGQCGVEITRIRVNGSDRALDSVVDCLEALVDTDTAWEVYR